MKTNFTYLRTCIAVVIFSIAFTTSNAQTGNSATASVSNLKATVQNNNLMVNWVVSEAGISDYCEVQASNDGKTFSTIGLVMGADPKQTNNSFIFKQGINKLKPGQVFYRILSKGTDGKAYTSDIVKTTI